MSAPLPASVVEALRVVGIPVEGDVVPEAQRGGLGHGDRLWLLTIRDGELAHRMLLLGPVAVVGSAEACDVVIEHPRVESRHLEVVPHDAGGVFRALGAAGFDCHGAHQLGEIDVAFGTPVFLDDIVMLTLEPWHDDASGSPS